MVLAKEKAIAKKENVEEIALLVSQGKISCADDLMKRYGVTFSQAIQLLSSQRFINLVAGINRVQSQLVWNSKALPRLYGLIEAEDNKTALTAIKMLGQMTDAIAKGGLEVNINLESMVTQNSRNLKNHNDLENVIELEEFRKVMNE